MAVIQQNKTTSAIMYVETSADKYEKRIIKNVNPSLSDEKFYEYFSDDPVSSGNISYGLAYFQYYPLNDLVRDNQYSVVKN